MQEVVRIPALLSSPGAGRAGRGAVRRAVGVFLMGTLMATALELQVSPDGDDANPGTAERPLRTLAGARDAVRRLNRDLQGDLVVLLHAGDYPLTSPVVFEPQDSGSNGYRVVYRAAAGVGSARILGLRRLRGWTRGDDGIWELDLGAPAEFHTLYENGRRARKARHPNYVHHPEQPTAAAPYLTSEDGSPLGQSGTDSRSWITWRPGDLDLPPLTLGQMKITLFPWGKCDWQRWTCPVTEMDPLGRRITFDNLGDATQILGQARYYLEDHPVFLDAPGEFYLDQTRGRLRYLPMADGDPNELDVSMPVVHDLIRLQGTGLEDPVHHLAFEGLTFEGTDGLAPVLHWWTRAWGRTDHGLIRLSASHHIEVRNCHLKNSGRHGILMVGENLYNTVSGCWIEQLGVNGVTLCTWPGRPKEAARNPRLEHNILTNNRIHDVGQLSLYAACIELLSGSHNEISNSEFYNSPRYAITLRGNTTGDTKGENLQTKANLEPATGNLFRHLRIHDCGQDSGDMGALHACMVNLPGGTAINTYEQITIENTRAVEGMRDIVPDGIFLDWPNQTMQQVFKNVHIVDSQGQPLRTNGPGNAVSAKAENVSWKKGFDPSRMQYEQIGLQADFPAEFGGQGESYRAPGVPTDLRGQAAGSSTVALTWVAPPDADSRRRLVYHIRSDGRLVGNTTETHFLDRGLVESSRYLYRLEAGKGPVGPRGASSAEIAVTTLPDTTPPTVVSARLGNSLKLVAVRFSKPVAKASSEARESYSIEPTGEVQQAQCLDGSPDTVLLTLTTALPGTEAHTITVQGILDRAATPNGMAGAQRLPIEAQPMLIHYALDEVSGEQALDSSGNGNHGRLEGESAWRPDDGRVCGALELDGLTGWIRGPDGIDLGAGDFTLAAWIWKATSGPAIVLAKGNGFTLAREWSWGWEWPTGANNIAFRATNRYWSTAPNSLEPRQWTHIAFVRQGGQGFSYVNGKPSGGPHDLSSLGDLSNDKPLRVGRREHEPAPAFFNGRLDDLRIYAAALTEGDIRALLADQCVTGE